MPRRTYNSKAGRRRPYAPDPDALLYLTAELQRRFLGRTQNATERKKS